MQATSQTAFRPGRAPIARLYNNLCTSSDLRPLFPFAITAASYTISCRSRTNWSVPSGQPFSYAARPCRRTEEIKKYVRISAQALPVLKYSSVRRIPWHRNQGRVLHSKICVPVFCKWAYY